MADDDRSKRTTPADGEDDWAFLFDGARKGHLAWRIVGPIHDAVKNWKAWLAIAGVALALNSPKLVEAVTIALEVVKP